MTIDEMIREHRERYPKQTVIDMVKLLYQSEFGCGHFVEDEAISLARLQNEIQQMKGRDREQMSKRYTEAIGEEYVRVYLDSIEWIGLDIVTLNRIFVLSSRCGVGTIEGFEKKLDSLQRIYGQLGDRDALEELQNYRIEHKKRGYPPVSHSELYRQAYQPAYRVIHKSYIQSLSLLIQIDKIKKSEEIAVIAIEGGSGAGKSTLGQLLSEVYDSNLYHMDDYFLRSEQRTEVRLSEIGGNVDYERFYEEVIKGIQSGQSFTYQPFSCKSMSLVEPVTVKPSKVHIIEGVYSLHPSFASCYNLKIFLDISREEQYRRILRRNGEIMYRRFVEEWIPKEDLYFETFQIPNQCQLIYTIENKLVADS